MLRPYVMEEGYVGEGGRPVNQIGPVAAQRVGTRHSDTRYTDTPHAARWVEPVDYDIADLIDKFDKLRTIVDPQSPYVQNIAYALGRAIDAEIVSAFFASSKTGAQGTGTAEAHSATYQIASGSAGLTVDKLITAKKLLMAAKVDIRNDPLYIAVTAKQHDDLLRETKVASRDYNSALVLEDGLINKFMGFKFIHLEDLELSGSDRYVPCWAKSGMHLGMWNDIVTRVSEMPSKRYSWQCYGAVTCGATRTQQGKVIRIACAE